MSPFPSSGADEASEQAPDSASETFPSGGGDDIIAPLLDGGGADAAASDDLAFTAATMDAPALDAGPTDAGSGAAWMVDLPPIWAPALDGGEVPPLPPPGTAPGAGGDAPSVPGDAPPPVPAPTAAPELPTAPSPPTIPSLPPVPPTVPVPGLPAAPPLPGLPTAPPPAPIPPSVPTLPPPAEPAPIPTTPPAPGPAPVPTLPPPAPSAPIPGLPPVPPAPPVPPLPPPPLTEPPATDAPPSPATDAPPPGDAPAAPVTDAPIAPAPGADAPIAPAPPGSDTPAPPGEVREVPDALPVDREVVKLPDGREILVVGGPEKCLDGRQKQGDNTMQAVGDCGLVSSRDVLLQFGINVSEDEIVKYAVANGLCQYDPAQSPEHRGGSNVIQRVELLRRYGVEAHIEVAGTAEQLAINIEVGRAVIIGIESDVLWRDGETPPYVATGRSDHAITVTGAVRDAKTGEVLGFTVNDSGSGKFNQFVSADLMARAWGGTGGVSVVTNGVNH